jgi:hypothetical protein
MQSGHAATIWLIKRCRVTNGLAGRTCQIAAAKYLALKQVFTQFPDDPTQWLCGSGIWPVAAGSEFWEVM